MTNMQLCTLSGWLAWQHYIWNVLCAALNLYQFVTNLFHSLELWCKWETALKGSFKKMLRKYEMILNWNWDYWEPVYSIFTILLRLMKITKIHQMHGCKNVQTGQCYFSGANFWARHAKIMSILLIALANITVDKIKNLESWNLEREYYKDITQIFANLPNFNLNWGQLSSLNSEEIWKTGIDPRDI